MLPVSAAPEKSEISADKKPEDQEVASLKTQLTRIRAALLKEHEMTRHDMARGYLYPRKVLEQVNDIKTDGLPADLVTAIASLKEASARECAHIKEMPADDGGAVIWMTDMQGDEKEKESSTDGKSFTAGSIYGGVMFEIAEGKVSQIFIGAGAE